MMKSQAVLPIEDPIYSSWNTQSQEICLKSQAVSPLEDPI